MPDMFGRETVLGGVMSSEATRLTFTSDTGLDAGLIMQQLNIQYAQNVTRLYALEDAKVYFVAGRTDGSLTIQHVIGPAGLQKAFIEAYSDVCKISGKVFNIALTASCGASGGGRSAVTLKCPLITAINIQMQAQNMIIGSGITAMFVSLAITENAGSGLFSGIDTATIGG